MEFVQSIADNLIGDEDVRKFSKKQLRTEEFENFSGSMMALERILIVRKKLFDWRQEGLAKLAAAANQSSRDQQSSSDEASPHTGI